MFWFISEVDLNSRPSQIKIKMKTNRMNPSYIVLSTTFHIVGNKIQDDSLKFTIQASVSYIYKYNFLL